MHFKYQDVQSLHTLTLTLSMAFEFWGRGRNMTSEAKQEKLHTSTCNMLVATFFVCALTAQFGGDYAANMMNALNACSDSVAKWDTGCPRSIAGKVKIDYISLRSASPQYESLATWTPLCLCSWIRDSKLIWTNVNAMYTKKQAHAILDTNEFNHHLLAR